jgi:two-component SAPR family response regulator
MSQFKDFIIIDDDEINNKLCRKIIEKTYPDAAIEDFTDPQEGFNFMVNKYAKSGSAEGAILLLDINMPVMDAWDFLELFEKVDEKVKSKVKVHILSSSVNKADMSRAQSNKNVEYYLIKPLTKESIRLIVHVLNKRLGIA